MICTLSTPGEKRVKETRKTTKAMRERTALMHSELLSCTACKFLIQVRSLSKPPTTSHSPPQTTPMFGAAENRWHLALKTFLPTSFGFAMNHSPISVYTEGVLTARICKALSKGCAPVLVPRSLIYHCNLQYLVTLTLKNTS